MASIESLEDGQGGCKRRPLAMTMPANPGFKSETGVKEPDARRSGQSRHVNQEIAQLLHTLRYLGDTGMDPAARRASATRPQSSRPGFWRASLARSTVPTRSRAGARLRARASIITRSACLPGTSDRIRFRRAPARGRLRSSPTQAHQCRVAGSLVARDRAAHRIALELDKALVGARAPCARRSASLPNSRSRYLCRAKAPRRGRAAFR